MSIVIAVKDRDRIILGADSQVSSMFGNKEHSCTKIWELAEMPGAYLGSVGSLRVLQIIQYCSSLDKNLISDDIDTAFVANVVVPALVADIEANGIDCTIVDPMTSVKHKTLHNDFIFAYKNKAWAIGRDLAITEINDSITIGSAADIAKGALYVNADKDNFKRVVEAICASADNTIYVDKQILFGVTEELEDDEERARAALGLPSKPKKESKQKNKKKKVK